LYLRPWLLLPALKGILSTCVHCADSFQGGQEMKKLFVLVIATLALASCNTFQGIGKDVKKAGEAVENAAKK